MPFFKYEWTSFIYSMLKNLHYILNIGRTRKNRDEESSWKVPEFPEIRNLILFLHINFKIFSKNLTFVLLIFWYNPSISPASRRFQKCFSQIINPYCQGIRRIKIGIPGNSENISKGILRYSLEYFRNTNFCLLVARVKTLLVF